MATGEAQHLVNALDQMIAKSPEHSRDISHNNQNEISELDDILAAVAGPQTEVNSTTEASVNKSLAVSAPAPESVAETASNVKEQQLSSQLDKFEQENSYIDIDKLLDASASSENKIEPYHDVDLDTGLDEFPEVVSNINNIDVDIDPNDSSKKLDLGRAYLEIDDQDSAREMLEQIELVGDEQQRKEAAKLLKKLAT
jgi:pilus assembly protein FimV